MLFNVPTENKKQQAVMRRKVTFFATILSVCLTCLMFGESYAKEVDASGVNSEVEEINKLLGEIQVKQIDFNKAKDQAGSQAQGEKFAAGGASGAGSDNLQDIIAPVGKSASGNTSMSIGLKNSKDQSSSLVLTPRRQVSGGASAGASAGDIVINKTKINTEYAGKIEVSVDDSSLDSFIVLGYKALKTGSLEAANKYFVQGLKKDPRSVEAMLGIALVNEQMLENRKAMDVYVKVLLRERNDRAYSRVLSIINKINPNDAIIAILKIRQKSSIDARMLCELSKLYVKNGNYLEAAKYGKEALELGGHEPSYVYNLAAIHDTFGNNEEAYGLYSKLVSYYRVAGSNAASHAEINLDAISSRLRYLKSVNS